MKELLDGYRCTKPELEYCDCASCETCPWYTDSEIFDYEDDEEDY